MPTKSILFDRLAAATAAMALSLALFMGSVTIPSQPAHAASAQAGVIA